MAVSIRGDAYVEYCLIFSFCLSSIHEYLKTTARASEFPSAELLNKRARLRNFSVFGLFQKGSPMASPTIGLLLHQSRVEVKQP